MRLDDYTQEQLIVQEQELAALYKGYKDSGLKLDLTRGKPNTAQVALSNALDGLLQGDFFLEDGTDTRNYGGLDGIPEARQLGAELLGLKSSEILVGGNSSLSMMYLYVLHACIRGVEGSGTSWILNEGAPKFIALVPGYDRHFTICESLGIDMIPVHLTDSGPDMDEIESLVKNHSIKGMWCVPKHSNPSGATYSDEVVQRIAKLAHIAAPNFRVLWDNAYAVHDLYDDAPELANVMEYCRQEGTEDSVIQFASTSKVSFAGGGISFVGASVDSLTSFKKTLSTMVIGHDKVNQLRHVRFFKNLDGIKVHMQKHAELIRPKFEAVLKHLNEGLTGKNMGEWTTPRGGYFVSFDTLPGLASEVVRMASEAGVKLTPAGATFPYGNDENNSNIRIAPTYPDFEDVDQAMKVFVTCVQLLSVRQRLDKLND